MVGPGLCGPFRAPCGNLRCPRKWASPSRGEAPIVFFDSVAEVEPERLGGGPAIEGHERQFVPPTDRLEELHQKLAKALRLLDRDVEARRIEQIGVAKARHCVEKRVDV